MLRFRPLRAPRRRLDALVLACLLVGAAGDARADAPREAAPSSTPSPPADASAAPSPSGAAALIAASAAWDKGAFAEAELYYKTALDQGELPPKDVLDAYVHLGAARAAQGKKTLARASFRQAALIDQHFKVPPEGGRRALAAAALARKDEAKLGSIVLRATFPQGVVPAGAPFTVDATLDGAHVRHSSLVARVGVDAVEPASGKHYEHAEVVATKVKLEVPADVVVAGATLVVRVQALDAHDNRLAEREQRIQVEAPPPPPEPPKTPEAAATPPPAPATKHVLEPVPPPPAAEAHHGGFWSSPWTYIAFGAVLAGAGAAAYVMTRPTDDVTVGGAHVQTR